MPNKIRNERAAASRHCDLSFTNRPEREQGITQPLVTKRGLVEEPSGGQVGQTTGEDYKSNMRV